MYNVFKEGLCDNCVFIEWVYIYIYIYIIVLVRNAADIRVRGLNVITVKFNVFQLFISFNFLSWTCCRYPIPGFS